MLSSAVLPLKYELPANSMVSVYWRGRGVFLETCQPVDANQPKQGLFFFHGLLKYTDVTSENSVQK